MAHGTQLRRSRIGQLLVLHRSISQQNVRDVARDIGISAATLSRIERGHLMDAETMVKIWTWLLSEATP